MVDKIKKNFVELVKKAKPVAKYLLGFDIKNSYKNERNVLKTSSSLGDKISLAMTHMEEVFRYPLRYASLANESALIYSAFTNPQNAKFLLISELVLRTADLGSYIKRRNQEQALDSLISLNSSFTGMSNKMTETINYLTGVIEELTRTSSTFRQIWNAKLFENPRSELGVSKDASEDEIKKAYRKIALETHPDKKPNDESANEKFLKATKAYYQLTGQYHKL